MSACKLRSAGSFAFPLRRGYDYDYITDLGRWPEYWPGLIRVEPGSRWSQPGDTARLTLRLLGRPTELAMTPQRVVPYRLIEYTSVQRGLPAARHERHFVEDRAGFAYRLVVEFVPRTGLRRPLRIVSSLRARSSAWRGRRPATWSGASPSCRRATTNPDGSEIEMTSAEDFRRTVYGVAQAIAPGWERQRARIEAAAAPLRDWLIRELAARSGDVVLELAAGAGTEATGTGHVPECPRASRVRSTAGVARRAPT